MGQTVNVSTSSVNIGLKKTTSLNMSQIIMGESDFNIPSFCSITNQKDNCQNKTLVIQVFFNFF